MDLTPLRPSARFLSVKVCKLGLAERSAAPRRLLIYSFAPLSRVLHRLFALLPAELAENPDRPTSRHVVVGNWFGQSSAITPRSSRDLSSIMMFADFALWPAFCSSSSQSKWTSWLWRATGVRGING